MLKTNHSNHQLPLITIVALHDFLYSLTKNSIIIIDTSEE